MVELRPLKRKGIKNWKSLTKKKAESVTLKKKRRDKSRSR
jgi:hypothetical protein